MKPSRFFPSDGRGVVAAQEVCSDCPVRNACLNYALVNRIEYGVWGGASERERVRILRRRRKAEAAVTEGVSRTQATSRLA